MTLGDAGGQLDATEQGDAGERGDRAAQGRPRRAAVLGSPVAHSLSPVLHRAAYVALGLDGWRYDAVDVDEAALPGFLAGLGGDWAGLSLTMPLKRAVIPLLGSVSPLARSVWAVNTVVVGPDGLHGDNTDVPGMVAALAEAGVRAPGSAVVLGAGATACSALAALAALGVRTAVVRARRPEAAPEVREVAVRVGIGVELQPWPTGAADLAVDVVVSTVPAGAADGLSGLCGVQRGTLFDVVYAPWPTAVASAWGGRVVGGLDLLVHQAALQVELMTGRRPPVAALREAGQRVLAERAAG